TLVSRYQSRIHRGVAAEPANHQRRAGSVSRLLDRSDVGPGTQRTRYRDLGVPRVLWLESLEPDAAWDGALQARRIPCPVEPPPVLVACGSGAARWKPHNHIRRRSELRKTLGRSVFVVPGRTVQLLGKLSRRARLDRTNHAVVPG